MWRCHGRPTKCMGGHAGSYTRYGSPAAEPMGEEPMAPRLSRNLRELGNDCCNHAIGTAFPCCIDQLSRCIHSSGIGEAIYVLPVGGGAYGTSPAQTLEGPVCSTLSPFVASCRAWSLVRAWSESKRLDFYSHSWPFLFSLAVSSESDVHTPELRMVNYVCIASHCLGMHGFPLF